MSWMLFLDESGRDRRESPYEVLAGVAVEDRNLWKLICKILDLQVQYFGMKFHDIYGREAKATKLLKKRIFRYAENSLPIEKHERTAMVHQILENGVKNGSFENLTALSQAKIDYCETTLEICKRFSVVAFASIIPRDVPRFKLNSKFLRKDYSVLFQSYYDFLNDCEDRPMGYLIFDELDKISSHLLLNQCVEYFQKTDDGKKRSELVIPEPLFVHSDLTTMIQVADMVAYTINWGVKTDNMHAPRRTELNGLSKRVLDLCDVRNIDGNWKSSMRVIEKL